MSTHRQYEIGAAKAEGMRSFIWESHPQYVKIGYSSSLAQDRLNEQLNCYPGATLSVNPSVHHPKRIESLIHLELTQYLYQFYQCNYRQCQRSHIEWFKSPIAKVIAVLRSWVDVMNAEAPHDTDGKLTTRWRKRPEHSRGRRYCSTATQSFLTSRNG